MTHENQKQELKCCDVIELLALNQISPQETHDNMQNICDEGRHIYITVKRWTTKCRRRGRSVKTN